MGTLSAAVRALMEPGRGAELPCGAAAALPSGAVAADLSPDLELKPLDRDPRPLGQWVANFHLVAVALDPYTAESAALLDTAGRILTHYEQADCRVAWLMACDDRDAHRFLGPWAKELLTFVDRDREVISALEIAELPAIVHVNTAAAVEGKAEGWQPAAWKDVTDHLAEVMSWSKAIYPGPKDPAPFAGSPV